MCFLLPDGIPRASSSLTEYSRHGDTNDPTNIPTDKFLVRDDGCFDFFN